MILRGGVYELDDVAVEGDRVEVAFAKAVGPVSDGDGARAFETARERCDCSVGVDAPDLASAIGRYVQAPGAIDCEAVERGGAREPGGLGVWRDVAGAVDLDAFDRCGGECLCCV